MSVKLSGENFEAELLQGGITVADFFSDSCIPCKRMSPIIAELEEELADVRFGKLNINFDAETAEKYGVTAVPTLIFFKDGEEKARLTGAQKKAAILETIDNIR